MLILIQINELLNVESDDLFFFDFIWNKYSFNEYKVSYKSYEENRFIGYCD